jgi:molybdate transport system substrate-binding protein
MSRRPRMCVLLAAVALLAGLAGTARASDPPTVFAAASLTDVFRQIDPSARYSFGGSNTLALQIRQGAPADVFASAAPNFTQELYRDGLVEKPRFLAFNRLTVIVPTSNPAGIDSVYDLTRSGVKLVVAHARVPVGSYTRTVFRNLGISTALRNVVSQESDVRDVLGKVVLGQADAGVVYATDARVAGSQVTRVAIPVFAQPKVRYEIAVVRASTDGDAAAAFIDRATGPRGRRLMARAGFRFPPPPKPKPGRRAR